VRLPGKGRNGQLGHKKSRLPFKALITTSDAGWPRVRDPQELLQRLTGWAAEWATLIIGPHTPLQALLWCYLISAIPATQSVETWLISVGVYCLLLRLTSLVPQQDDFLARGCTATTVGGRTTERVRGRTGQRQVMRKCFIINLWFWPYINFVIYNLFVSPLHCNHQYHANFDICHDLHGLIIGEHVSHIPEEIPSYIVSHRTRTTIRFCLNKKVGVHVCKTNGQTSYNHKVRILY
jgi:hypothetical protein